MTNNTHRKPARPSGLNAKGTNPTERRAWSIDEWRAMYGFGRNYTYNLIADGTLPTVKLRRRRIVTVEGDEQFRKNIGA